MWLARQNPSVQPSRAGAADAVSAVALAPFNQPRIVVVGESGFTALATPDQVDLLRRCMVVADQLVEIAGGDDGSVLMREAGSKTPITVLADGHSGPVTAVVCGLLGDRPMAYTGGADGAVRVWDLLDRHLADVLEMGGTVWAIDVTAAGDLVVCVGDEVIAFRHVSAVAGRSS